MIRNKIQTENATPVIIATARSRFSKQWKTERVSWKDLVERVQTPQFTSETVREYRSMSKAEKGRIKDVGGFVGGALNGPTRGIKDVKSRTLLTLDLDHIKDQSADDVWETFTLFHQEAAFVYSTHSHRPDRPRLRLVLPLRRTLHPEEYEPVARRVAAEVGIDLFDDTTFEINRLMFWPSCPRDGEFFFRYQEGPWLDPDSVLSTYNDWHDTMEWPLSSREDQIIERAKKAQENPLEKKGLVGAFCRSYSISEAITAFLSDVYAPTEKEDRYTYKDGSTFGGLVVYDERFAYSHHSTDPTSRMLCNAFDLVRVHRFGGLDADEDEQTPTTRRKSYQKMLELAQGDERVKATLLTEKLKRAEEEFTFDAPTGEGKSEAGETGPAEALAGALTFDKKGNVENTIDNIVNVLELDPRLAGKFQYDTFANRATVKPGVPWAASGGAHDWQDLDDSGLHQHLESVYGIAATAKVEDAKNLVFDRHKFHPVRDYLNALQPWDGTSRVKTLFHDYLGAADGLYPTEVTTVHLVGAVARVMDPGCKYDTMVILAGPQGIGKSTFIQKLAGEWYSDSVYTIKGKEAAELIQGVWHIELGEMSAMKKSDRDAVKAFLSKRDDVYRIAYAKNTTRFPRQCVFWGTSNEYNFLRDPTGDRRSYPIDCGLTAPTKDIFTDLDKERDQIWAEALTLYRSGAPTILTGEALRLAVEAQNEHKEENPWAGPIMEYLERTLPSNWFDLELHERRAYLSGDTTVAPGAELQKLDKVCVLQVWCEVFGKDKASLRPLDSVRINETLVALPDWDRHPSTIRFGKEYGRQRGFIRNALREDIQSDE